MGQEKVTGRLPSAKAAGVPPLTAPKPLPVGHSTALVTSFHCRGRGGAAGARRSSLGGAPPRKAGRGAPVYPGGLC